jgi:cellulose synthase/poly-beta-1,6-N-acetylglucosamine synthase-like glycosyltransferase
VVSIFFCLLLCAVCLALVAPIIVIAVQILVAALQKPRDWRGLDPLPFAGRPPIAIIVPAHNESSAVAKTIESLKSQMSPDDRLLVVADNCTDDTAAQALKHGATVVERHNLLLRGKGHALDHGWKTLSTDARFALFLCVDADCVVHPGAVNELARKATATGRPVQALYLILNEGLTSVRQRVSEFAYIVKGLVRPVGFDRLGLPCQLGGSGMMFPRALLEQQSLASGHLVEDLLLGLTLCEKGSAPVFCDTAYVTSTFPVETGSQESQRTRWEHGHLSVIVQVLPRLLARSIARLDLNLFAQALDAAVPPVTLLLLLQTAAVVASAVFLILSGLSAPLWIAGTGLVALFATLVLAWTQFGRERLSGKDLVQASLYIAWKFPLYIRYLFARQTEWVRTKRDASKD